MKTADFLSKHDACIEYVEWATSTSQDMSVVWDELISQARRDWLIWTATSPGVFPDSILRKLACRFVRETPLVDGRTVWDLLTDERSRKAIEVTEAYVDGNATKKELVAAAARAADAAAASHDAAYAASAYAAAAYAAASASRAAYWDADAAQVRMVAELGNPFKER